jgi:sterol desaturase/sphingolipid hydroxylase (fatty acid hydroxylase superfamily)
MQVLVFGAVFRWGRALAVTAGGELWPTAWPWVLQLGLALVVAELGSYWLHRVQHGVGWLWRMHATHHSVPRLYWLNTSRFHPLDAVVSYLTLMLPLVLLGVPYDTLAIATAFMSVHSLLQHSNIDLRHGPCNWLFSTAELHRWHHALDADDSNHNYGTVLAVWDVVFGTRYLPKDRRPPEAIGIPGMPQFPQTYLAQLASPFTWKRIAPNVVEPLRQPHPPSMTRR